MFFYNNRNYYYNKLKINNGFKSLWIIIFFLLNKIKDYSSLFGREMGLLIKNNLIIINHRV